MSKRGKYGKWTEKEMELALDSYRNDTLGLNACSKTFNIPKATLLRHLKGTNQRATEAKQQVGGCQWFDDETESEIVKHLLRLEERLFGMSITQVRQLAYQVAEAKGMARQFNASTKMAGKKWYYKFMARHPELSLRQPELTSMARAKGFNKSQIKSFFDLLESLCDKHKFSATQIYNVDESGFSVVQKKATKVIGKRGKHQIGAISSGERGVNTTMVCCVSAAGHYVPPMIIFKRKRFTQELALGAPPGSCVTISETGYINSELFVVWLRSFIDCVKPTTEKPVLLLLDGHTTHTRNLEALELARKENVILVQLPAHTTHRLQPLDVSFFKPLETYYVQAVEKWLRTNVGCTVSQYQVSQLLGEAYSRAATIETASNGFRNTGVWPVDRNVFKDHHFAAAECLTFPEECEVERNEFENASAEENVDEPEPTGPYSDTSDAEGTAAQKRQKIRKPELEKNVSRNSCSSISIEEISPLPKATKKLKKRAAKELQPAVELTSSPYKKVLIESKKRVDAKMLTKEKNKTKRKLAIEARADKIRKKKQDIQRPEWYCKICEAADELEMIQCLNHKCREWVHARCAKVKPSQKVFYCYDCTDG